MLFEVIEDYQSVGDKLLIKLVTGDIVELVNFWNVVSFISILEGKIVSLDEYWSDDGGAPSWRQEMNIGVTIK